MHNAEKPNPPASVRDTWGKGGLWASSNTRARNSLRAVAPHSAASGGVHGEGAEGAGKRRGHGNVPDSGPRLSPFSRPHGRAAKQRVCQGNANPARKPDMVR